MSLPSLGAELTLTRLSLNQLFHFFLRRATGSCASCLRSLLLPRDPLQLLAFFFIFNLLCVHDSVFNPANLSTSFFNPCPGKLMVSFASSPSPSRLSTVPRPYRGCSTTDPGPKVFLPPVLGRICASGGGGLPNLGCCEAVCKAGCDACCGDLVGGLWATEPESCIGINGICSNLPPPGFACAGGTACGGLA